MKTLLKNNKGFTFAELLVVLVFIVFLCIGIFCPFIMGNFWFLNADVLKKIQINHPGATEVVDAERNIFKYSVIIVKENGVNKTYYLDTDVLWNYEIHEINE